MARDRSAGGDKDTRRKKRPAAPKAGSLFGAIPAAPDHKEHTTASSRPLAGRKVRVRVQPHGGRTPPRTPDAPSAPERKQIARVEKRNQAETVAATRKRTGLPFKTYQQILDYQKEAKRAPRAKGPRATSPSARTYAHAEEHGFRPGSPGPFASVEDKKAAEREAKHHAPRTIGELGRRSTELATGIDPVDPLSHGPYWLAGNLAMSLPVLRGPRALFTGARLVSEGRTAAEAAQAARASMHEAGPLAKTAGKVTKEVQARRLGTKMQKAGARVGRELEKSPVRARAHEHFDATSPTPEAAQAQKDLYDQKILDLTQSVAHKPSAVTQIVRHLRGQEVRPAPLRRAMAKPPAMPKGNDPLSVAARSAEPDVAHVSEDLGDLHFLYQIDPPEIPAMPKRIKGGPLHQKVYDYAKRGAAWRDWYQRASWMVALAAKHEGVTYDQMAQIVAITSQGANPTFNLRLAVEAIQNYKRFGEVKIGPKDPYIFDPQEVESVLKGGEWEGRKRSSFYQNITNDTDHVTVDRHIAQMLFGTDSPSEKQYQIGEQIFREIGDQLGWAPKEVQAAAWVPFKAERLAEGSKKSYEDFLATGGDAYEQGWRNLQEVGRKATSKAKPPKLSENEVNRATIGYTRSAGQDMEGLPTNIKYNGRDIPVHSNRTAQALAEDYMNNAGLPYHPPVNYAKVDKERAKRIAEWYDKAPDMPNDPHVREAYDAMAKETLAQYDEITRAGYQFEFYPEGRDPYPRGPREAMLDLQQNRHMYVFPTKEGFGTEAAAAAEHPLLADSGVQWGGKAATHNDIFRAVHDFFGHFKEGVGFRAEGEENAWRAHSAMYSDTARPAMTSETRGQNSWVNFGPHGEANRTASQADTVYADQKATLAPDWVVNEGSGAPAREALPELPAREPSGLSFADDAAQTLDESKRAAYDIARLVPEDEWPPWVKNVLHEEIHGRPQPVDMPNPPSPLDTDRGPTQRYMENLVGEKFPDVVPDSWTAKFGGKMATEGLGMGFPLGWWDDTDHGLIPALLNKIRGKGKAVEEAAADVPLTPEQEAVDKLSEGLKGSKGKRKQMERKRTAERGRRLGAATEAMNEAEGLEASLAAAKEHLKGTLPRLTHDGLRGLTVDEVDLLSAIAKEHPALNGWERIRVQDTIRNAWLEGTPPTKSEREVLDRAFGEQFVEVAFSKTALEKYKDVSLDILNIPRSLMASFDVSAPFRQGLVAFARHPILTGKNLGPMFKYLSSDKRYREFMSEIEDADDFDEMMDAGLSIVDADRPRKSTATGEEAFQSDIAEKITGGKRGPVAMSSRAYTGFLVKTRVDMFRYLRSVADKQGYELDKKALGELADYVNAATGRGGLGPFEKSANVLNAIFFSPRLMGSRLHFLNPKGYIAVHPFVRRQKIRAAMQTVGAVGAILWLANEFMPGAHVELNPTSSDFGKIRVGNTRIDVAGGFVQYVRFLSQMAIEASGHGDGTGPDKIMRFFRGKESPVASLATDLATHTNYAGMPITDIKKEFYDSFIPLVYQDVRDVYRQTEDPFAAAGTLIASSTGIGVNTYGKDVKKGEGDKVKKGSMEEAKQWETKVNKVSGYLPPEIAQARESKVLYHDYLDEWKKENNVSDASDYQLTKAKIHILTQTQPAIAAELNEQLGYAKGDSQTVGIINRYVEKALLWDQVDQYNKLLKAANGG